MYCSECGAAEEEGHDAGCGLAYVDADEEYPRDVEEYERY